jgi:glutamate formiminotransferase
MCRLPGEEPVPRICDGEPHRPWRLGWDIGAGAPAHSPSTPSRSSRSDSLSASIPRSAAGSLEAVVNISEGRDRTTIAAIGEPAQAAGVLLDVHSDPHHNRSVFTLAGSPPKVTSASYELCLEAIGRLDINEHTGVHPRIGVVDVVPFVAYGLARSVAIEARESLMGGLAKKGVPCYRYGFFSRGLPEIRRGVGAGRLSPDAGPSRAHPTAGYACVGARDPLVAYNLVVDCDLSRARAVSAQIRNKSLRSLAFQVGEEVQVSCNLVEPAVIGVSEVYDCVAGLVGVRQVELVGLIPEAVLAAAPKDRWNELGISPDQTIESRLELAARSG